MQRRTFLASASAVGTGLLAGWGGDNQPDNPGQLGTTTSDDDRTATETVGSTVTFTIEDKTLKPRVHEVPVNTAVVWENNDGTEVSHILVSSTRSNHTEEWTENAVEWTLDATILKDESLERVLEEPGVYEFFSRRGGDDFKTGWESMCGAVVVGDVAFEQSELPCEDGSSE